ncbi:uncharacterized protein BYT42DRAFT_558759 [Radiomyces spectabilis]|uniref:uncharacterized protein n=1 Tax=Radiomyces spectabilis TaxID=64574 RepID=UPI00221F6AD1|nr:uncharacterized protein BYT42DRAFT_558759 [Radiomyces spectabilis]KAI8388050.1 hypothetical protein BYT42DRAFT_558759 [Radiomyces spectabilis]
MTNRLQLFIFLLSLLLRMAIRSKFPDVQIPDTGLIEFLFAQNQTSSSQPILIDATTNKTITYGQLKDSVLRFAAGLQDKCDFRKGDILLLYSPNQIDYSIPLMGTIAAGGITSPANPAYNVDELVHQLEDTKSKVLIAHPSNLDRALAAAQRVGLPKDRVYVFGDVPVEGVLPYASELLGHRLVDIEHMSLQEARETVAYLAYSSGTTGKSKGVMTTHGNIIANVLQYDAIERPFINFATERILGVLPFFHMFGLTVILHQSVYWGIPVYVMPSFDLQAFCETVQQHKITKACLVPPIILLLAKHPLVLQYDLSSLRLIISGAAPLSGDLIQEAKKRLTTTVIKQGYGLTETSPVAVIELTDRAMSGTIGHLVPNMTARIVDEDGKDVGINERGELWLKGPNIMKAYFNNTKATAESIDAEGYFHTGDIAVLDERGVFAIVDRKKELIKYKGFQVPPAELEAILLTSPIVADCAVIGIYDEEKVTEIPRAYVVLKPDVPATEATRKELEKFVADQVVHYKRIRSVVFIDAIPKSAAGKILRRVLRDSALSEQKSKSKL